MFGEAIAAQTWRSEFGSPETAHTSNPMGDGDRRIPRNLRVCYPGMFETLPQNRNEDQHPRLPSVLLMHIVAGTHTPLTQKDKESTDGLGCSSVVKHVLVCIRPWFNPQYWVWGKRTNKTLDRQGAYILTTMLTYYHSWNRGRFYNCTVLTQLF